jgi:hypothetical protein
LKLSDGRVLFLRGQYLCGLEEDQRFPCTSFEIVRALQSRELLALNCSGEFFKPTKTLVPFQKHHFAQDLVPEDGTRVPLPWENIEKTYI